MREASEVHGSSETTGRRAARAMVVAAAALALWLSAGASPAMATSPSPACSSGTTGGGGAPLYTTQTAPQDPFVPTELVPDQWLAKLFTEGLGCAPDQTSYAGYDQLVRAEGCGQSTLAGIGISFLTSRQFLRRSYGYAERLLVLWWIARES